MDDALDVVVGEETLGAFAGDFVDGVDEQDFIFPRLGFGGAANDDARLHWRVVKKIRTETEHTFDEVGFDQFAAHVRFFLPEQHAVRPKHGATAGLGIQTLDDVLLKSVVGAALRRSAVKISSPRIRGKGGAIPLLDGIRRVGQAHVKTHQAVALHQFGFGQRVAALDAKILDAVEKTIHPGDGGGHKIALLPEQLHVAPLFFLPAQVCDTREQHAAGATSRVIHGFTGLHVQHLGHQMNHGAVGVKFGGGVAGVVGKFLDQVFVTLAQFILGQIGDGEFQCAEMLNHVAQHGVRKPVFVRPLSIAKDAVEFFLVGRLNVPHGGLKCHADVFCRLPHITPV